MKTTHPNRLNKRRGNKLNSWSHTSCPVTEKEAIEIKQQLDDKEKIIKKSNTKKKEYEVWVKWAHTIFNDRDWSRHGKFLKYEDALKSFNTSRNKSFQYSNNSKIRYYFSHVKLTRKGHIMLEACNR